MTDMKYRFRPDGPTDSYWDMFFPWTHRSSTSSSPASPISASSRPSSGATSPARGSGSACLALTAFVYLAKNRLPVIGLLWNPRLLPFLYLAAADC